MQKGRTDQAIASFERANTLTANPDVVYNLGVCHYTVNNFAIAKDYFEQSLQFFSEDGEACYLLGCCEWELGYKERALEAWMMSLQLLHTPAALQSLAFVCEWHGYHLAAIHCYQRLKKLHSSQVDWLHGLAWNYALLDNVEEANRYFQELFFY